MFGILILYHPNMDKLQWFKFTPTDWIMGKIQRTPEITQARFMRLICLYWNKECVLTIEDAEIEIDKEHLDILISKKILKTDADLVRIEFLDEQFQVIKYDLESKSKSGVIGNLKRWHKSIYSQFMKGKITFEQAIELAKGSHTDCTPIAHQSQNIAEQNRVDTDETLLKENEEVTSAGTFETNAHHIEVVEPEYYGSEKQFLTDFNTARKHYDKIETDLENLVSYEKTSFKEVKIKYPIPVIRNALHGMFMQKGMFPVNRLRPKHFLENIELYNECELNGIKLFEDKKSKAISL